MSYKIDDGLGPYTYCKKGKSRCNDQLCDCVDTLHYRAEYLKARRELGWPITSPSARYIVTYLGSATILGALAGLMLLVLTITIMKLLRL